MFHHTVITVFWEKTGFLHLLLFSGFKKLSTVTGHFRERVLFGCSTNADVHTGPRVLQTHTFAKKIGLLFSYLRLYIGVVITFPIVDQLS